MSPPEVGYSLQACQCLRPDPLFGNTLAGEEKAEATCQVGNGTACFLGIICSLLAGIWLRRAPHKPICKSSDGPWLMSMQLIKANMTNQ